MLMKEKQKKGQHQVVQRHGMGESWGAMWPAMPPHRHALAIAAHVSHRLQPIELLSPVLPIHSLATASLYRLSRIDAFPSFFLASLYGPTRDSTEALRLVDCLLAAAPVANAALQHQAAPALPIIEGGPYSFGSEAVQFRATPPPEPSLPLLLPHPPQAPPAPSQPLHVLARLHCSQHDGFLRFK